MDRCHIIFSDTFCPWCKANLVQPFAGLWTVKNLELWDAPMIASREQGGGWRESSLENACLHAPIWDLALNMLDHAWRRCTSHAAAGRCVLFSRVALRMSPDEVSSTCLSLRLVLPNGVLPEIMSMAEEKQKSKFYIKHLLASTKRSGHSCQNHRNNVRRCQFL